MKGSLRIYNNAEPINSESKLARVVYQPSYNKFISSSRTSLNKGYTISVFTEEQLKVLQDEYKDNLGNPIKVDNIKFKVKKKIRLSNMDLCKLKMDVFISNRNSRRNRRNVHIFVKKRK